MKTLNEQVAEIKSAKMSKVAKREAFIKLGLRPYEISLLMSEMPKKVKSVIYTFGVEIECLMSRNLLVANADSNFKYQYEIYNHDDNKDYYKFVSDASINGSDGIECVSPILKGKEGMKSLKVCCDSLNNAGARVNRSTGLHVHIGVPNLTGKHYVNIFKNYQMLEGVIDSFMANSRRNNNNTYCRSLQGYHFNLCGDVSDVNRMLRSRYFKVNPMSYSRHRTIEFRQHQGTTDYEKISHWVDFLMKLVAWSEKNVLASEVRSIDEIPFITENEKRYYKSRREALA